MSEIYSSLKDFKRTTDFNIRNRQAPNWNPITRLIDSCHCTTQDHIKINKHYPKTVSKSLFEEEITIESENKVILDITTKPTLFNEIGSSCDYVVINGPGYTYIKAIQDFKGDDCLVNTCASDWIGGMLSGPVLAAQSIFLCLEDTWLLGIGSSTGFRGGPLNGWNRWTIGVTEGQYCGNPYCDFGNTCRFPTALGNNVMSTSWNCYLGTNIDGCSTGACCPGVSSSPPYLMKKGYLYNFYFTSTTGSIPSTGGGIDYIPGMRFIDGFGSSVQNTETHYGNILGAPIKAFTGEDCDVSINGQTIVTESNTITTGDGIGNYLAIC